MLEVLIKSEPRQEVKDRALEHALSLKRLDLIKLLVLHGADIRTIEFIEVLRIWEPTIIRFFLDQGAEFVEGSPFAVAFGEGFGLQLARGASAKRNIQSLRLSSNIK